MLLIKSIRNSKLLRAPLLAATSACLAPLTTRIPLLRRAAYDTKPMPYLVVGDREQYVVSTKDQVIGRELFLHGEFDIQKLESALSILRREGNPTPTHLVDVGANIGTIVIPALVRGLAESATAIEPHPDNVRLLHANLALNGVAGRVRVLEQAVGPDADAILLLQESLTNSGNHSIGRNGIPVPSTRLDDVEYPRADSLLWMDIEGYEGHALRGATQLLAAGIPVVVEFNPELLDASNGFALLREALKDRLLFDLKKPHAGPTSLDDLSGQYAGGESFTDILAIVPT